MRPLSVQVSAWHRVPVMHALLMLKAPLARFIERGGGSGGPVRMPPPPLLVLIHSAPPRPTGARPGPLLWDADRVWAVVAVAGEGLQVRDTKSITRRLPDRVRDGVRLPVEVLGRLRRGLGVGVREVGPLSGGGGEAPTVAGGGFVELSAVLLFLLKPGTPQVSVRGEVAC